MEYLSIEQAKQESGLRLVLTKGVPGPWSEVAKALFNWHRVDFSPVVQYGGQDNPDLVEWTKHRNAPIALYQDEAPRVRWLEILDLAERLGSGPSLIPQDRAQRIFMIGLINEIAGDKGLAWNARLLMLDAAYQMMGEAQAAKMPMFADYQYQAGAIDAAKQKIESFLTFLAQILKQQTAVKSDYLIGSELTAVDIFWAYFSNMLDTLPAELNPMPDGLRQSWAILGQSVSDFDPIVIEHRDRIFKQHLKLPLEF